MCLINVIWSDGAFVITLNAKRERFETGFPAQELIAADFIDDLVT